MDLRRDMGLQPSIGLSSYEESHGNPPFSWVSNNMHSHCIGGKVLEEELMNYTLQFHQNYADQPRFVYNHFITSHVDSQNGLMIIDEEFRKFLSEIPNNTFIMLV